MLNNKIKNFIFQKFFHYNGDKIDYVTNLKDYFDNNLKKMKKSDDLLKVIQNILEDLSNQNHIKYYIYSKVPDKNHLWKTENSNHHWNITHTDSNSFSDKSLVTISQVQMKSDSLSNEITQNVLEINLPGEDLFYIEARNCNPENLFYFKSELQTFFQNYFYEREIQSLKEEQKKNEKRFEESEKKVISANKEIRRKVYELHNLVEASNDIYSILDFKQLINSSLLTIIGQVGFQKAFVLLYNSENNKFDHIVHKGFADNKLENLEFDLSSPIVRYFFKNRTPLYISRLEQNKDLKSFARKLNKMGIIVLAPLIYSERLQGVIGAGEKLHFQNFTEADFEIFHILVNIISISIGNSRMFQEIRTLSLTDAMTGLHNYRYFEDRLKEEINRAKRHGKDVSLMILDIDHFKNYNDTLGHQAGDEILRKIGKILKDTIRDEDIVARYGGEEFCIILPGIKKSGIQILGERVRKKVESETFFKEEVQPEGKLTISIGTATFPEDANTYSDLVERADKALYKAKNAGRNQLKIYDDNSNGA